MPEFESKEKVIVVGAGVSGLCCALELQRNSIPVTVLEASDSVGGRIKTDQLSGFQLDRGFQVLLTSYPEARKELDFAELQLGHFEPGALIRHGKRFHKFYDPWRKPLTAFSAVVSPLVKLGDKLKIAKLRHDVCQQTMAELWDKKQVPTEDYLKSRGFSDKIIERFFRPFFGGVFLESQLATSSRKFEYLFRMFSLGQAALPRTGIQAIPEQLARKLEPGTVQFGKQVSEIRDHEVVLRSGETLGFSNLVLATPESATAKLLNLPGASVFNQVECHYFSADQSPLKSRSLVLNGEGKGPINSLCVPSDVCSCYAPPGKSLISISVLEDQFRGSEEESRKRVEQQLEEWFGSMTQSWQHLRSYRIACALPRQTSDRFESEIPSRISESIFTCGDYQGISSIQGAMESGRMAGEAVVKNNPAACVVL